MIHVDKERMSDKICIIRYLGTKGIRYVSVPDTRYDYYHYRIL